MLQSVRPSWEDLADRLVQPRRPVTLQLFLLMVIAQGVGLEVLGFLYVVALEMDLSLLNATCAIEWLRTSVRRAAETVAKKSIYIQAQDCVLVVLSTAVSSKYVTFVWRQQSEVANAVASLRVEHTWTKNTSAAMDASARSRERERERERGRKEIFTI